MNNPPIQAFAADEYDAARAKKKGLETVAAVRPQIPTQSKGKIVNTTVPTYRLRDEILTGLTNRDRTTWDLEQFLKLIGWNVEDGVVREAIEDLVDRGDVRHIDGGRWQAVGSTCDDSQCDLYQARHLHAADEPPVHSINLGMVEITREPGQPWECFVSDLHDALTAEQLQQLIRDSTTALALLKDLNARQEGESH